MRWGRSFPPADLTSLIVLMLKLHRGLTNPRCGGFAISNCSGDYMKKILSIITVMIAVVIIAAIAFIKIYITPERVKAFVVPAAESALNRKVDIGEIDINIFKGIGIKGFVIKEADGESDFVKCEEFVLRFKLLPLLTKKVVIDEIKLVSPEIRVRRDKEGKFNFEDIGKKEGVTEAKPGEAETDEAEFGLPISLLMSSIVISDARFSFVDLKKELPDLKTTLNINISIESAGTSEIITRGSIDLRLDELILRGKEEGLIRDMKAALEYAVRVDLETLDIQIEKADLEFQEIPISISGSVKGLKASPILDLHLSLPSLKIAKLQEIVATFIKVEGLGLSGGLSADMKLKGEPGKLESMKITGNIALEKVGVSYEDLNALLDGEVKFSKDVINVRINTTVGRNTAELKGSIRNYFENQDIKMDLYAKKLFIDELVARAAEPGARSGKSEPVKEKGPQKEARPLKLKLKAEGTVKIDSAVYKGMTMSNFLMKYRFRDNKLEIPRLTANAGKGKFDLKSVLDLSQTGYRYDLTTNLDSLHAQDVVNAFFPTAKDTVFGLLSFNLKMRGAGTLPESIKKNLVANCEFNIKDGKITNLELTKKLSRFMNIDELETINLRKANGKVDIKNGVVRLDSVFSSDDIEMDPKGKIGLDETLDLEFDLKLSSRLTDKAMLNSSIAKFMKNDKGWGVIPLKISGTLSEPSYAIDMKKAGKRVIKKEADKFLDKIFRGNGNGNGKNPEDAVKNLLKGLFR